MTLIVIVVLFLVFKALREKRPLKIVLTPEEAHAVRARWWASAKRELLAWAVCAGLAGALFAQDLESAHWKPMTYVAIVWGSLILFSRLAIWTTLALAVLAYLVYATGIHLWPPVAPFVMASGCVYAIVARAILFIFAACRPVRPLSQSRPQRRYVRDLEDRNP
jgi:hypothetical protein